MSPERPNQASLTAPAVATTADGRANAPRRNLAPLYAGGLVVLVLLVLAMNFGGNQKPKPQAAPPPSTSSANDLSGLLEEEAARKQRSLPQRRPAPPPAASVPEPPASEPAAASPSSTAGGAPAGVYDPNRPSSLVGPQRTPPSKTPPLLTGLESLDRALAAPANLENRPAVRYRAGSPTPPSVNPPSDPAGAALASLAAELPLLAQPPQPADRPASRGDSPSSRYITFLDAVGNDRSETLELGRDRQKARSPFLLLQGTQIPAVLETGINSELPGQASGYIRKDVYDTLTGRYLLIPQGSRLIGSYNSDVVWGASRLLLVWNRLILPDGTSYPIVAPSSDLEGTAGLPGRVNNHWAKTLGSALMLSAISAGVQISQNPTTITTLGRTPSPAEAAGAAVGQELGQVSANVIRKNLEIPPNISLRPGLTYNVVLTRDVAFPHPYLRRAR
ncbi:MAG TPA: TrbI/VirB10 family protein [Thermoanaerobaculia bacterium]|jgi:type IV secretion system protein VirB10|nr:TrbI/VirB10 family protein [Thermoanaerobaculia bacterium]